MPMSADDVKELKSLLAAATKRPVNFGLCLGDAPADTVFVMHRQRDGKALAALARKEAGGTHVCHGAATLAGKELTLSCEVKPPSGMAKALQTALKAHGVTLTVKLAQEGSEVASAPKKGASGISTAKHPDHDRFYKEADTLAKSFDASVSRLDGASGLRAQRDFALSSAEDGDFTAAFKALDKVKAEFAKALAAHGNKVVEKFLEGFDKVKAALDDDTRTQFRKDLQSQVIALVGKSPAADVEAAARALVARLAGEVKQQGAAARQARGTVKAEADKVAKEANDRIEALSKEVAKLETQVQQTEKRIAEITKQLNGATRPKKAQAEKLAQTLATLQGSIQEQRQAVLDKAQQIKPEVDKLAKGRDEAAQRAAAVYANLDHRIEGLSKSIRDLPFADVHKELASTIGAMADATVWREGVKGVGGEVRRNAGGDGHGSARHGAQTGIERQARRSATGGAAPDGRGGNAATQGVRGTGATVRTTSWKKVSIEWEEVDGKRKVKSKAVVQKAILGELANWTNIPADGSTSVFANPVLEKLAVDTAIAKLSAKGWTQIRTNAGWQDLTKVALFLGPPSKYGKPWKGWGYSLTRKEVGVLALDKANEVLDEFEKGDITEKKMLEKLGVQYLMDGDVVAMVPYVRVVLTRPDGNAKWQSLTHFPDKDEHAERWDIEGRQVRKGTAVETATF